MTTNSTNQHEQWQHMKSSSWALFKDIPTQMQWYQEPHLPQNNQFLAVGWLHDLEEQAGRNNVYVYDYNSVVLHDPPYPHTTVLLFSFKGKRH